MVWGGRVVSFHYARATCSEGLELECSRLVDVASIVVDLRGLVALFCSVDVKLEVHY